MQTSNEEDDKDKDITTKPRSQLLLEEFDSDGTYIGNDSDTEESQEMKKIKTVTYPFGPDRTVQLFPKYRSRCSEVGEILPNVLKYIIYIP